MPAQVPNTGFPAAMCAAMGSNRPVDRSSLPCVVLSPPGRITRSIESSKSSAARSSFHGRQDDPAWPHARRTRPAPPECRSRRASRMPSLRRRRPTLPLKCIQLLQPTDAPHSGCSTNRSVNRRTSQQKAAGTCSTENHTHPPSPSKSITRPAYVILAELQSNQAIDESTDHSPRAAMMV